jgi:hypothetical protein
MNPITNLGFVSALAILLTDPAAARAEVSVISAWQHCEPMKGCLKFAFLPNGRVIKQYPLAGSIVTAYGRYHIRGTVLKIGWHRFEPAEVCAAHIDVNGATGRQCISSDQDDIKGPFHFEGMNSLVWSAPGTPPLRLVRVEL